MAIWLLSFIIAFSDFWIDSFNYFASSGDSQRSVVETFPAYVYSQKNITMPTILEIGNYSIEPLSEEP